MEGMPSRELLESVHEFPCAYTFKVIGTPDDHFVGRVVTAVKQHLPADAEPSFSSRKSTSGKHICVTIEPLLESADMVLEVYASLHALDGVIMLM